MTPHIIRRTFSGFVRRLPVVSVNKESKSILKQSAINGYCRISNSIRVRNFTRQPRLTTELNNDLQSQLNSSKTLEDAMNLLSPELSGCKTLQGFYQFFSQNLVCN